MDLFAKTGPIFLCISKYFRTQQELAKGCLWPHVTHKLLGNKSNFLKGNRDSAESVS